MRKIISALAIYSMFLTNTSAGISEEVKKLGTLAFGSSLELTVRAKNEKDLFVKFIESMNGDFEADRFVTKEIDQMTFGDEIDYGFTSTKSAIEMKDFAASQMEDLLEGAEGEEARNLKIKIYDLNKNWARSVKALEYQGARFAYDGNGPGYCGVSFIRLLILDVKTNQVYAVNLSQSGPC